MIKKLFLFVLLSFCLSVPALADSGGDFLMATPVYNAPASDSALGETKISLANNLDKQIEVYSIRAMSDLSSSELVIQQGDEAGVTTSYTTKFLYDVGNASITLDHDGMVPIFIGDAGYELNFEVSSTSSNALVVMYKLR